MVLHRKISLLIVLMTTLLGSIVEIHDNLLSLLILVLLLTPMHDFQLILLATHVF